MYISSENYLPCYLVHLTDLTPAEDKVTELEKLLQEHEIGGYCDKKGNYPNHCYEDGEFHTDSSNKELSIMYSVTTEEKGWKDWVDMAEWIPGSTIHVTERHGRTCYLCIVPLEPRL